MEYCIKRWQFSDSGFAITKKFFWPGFKSSLDSTRLSDKLPNFFFSSFEWQMFLLWAIWKTLEKETLQITDTSCKVSTKSFLHFQAFSEYSRYTYCGRKSLKWFAWTLPFLCFLPWKLKTVSRALVSTLGFQLQNENTVNTRAWVCRCVLEKALCCVGAPRGRICSWGSGAAVNSAGNWRWWRSRLGLLQAYSRQAEKESDPGVSPLQQRCWECRSQLIWRWLNGG